METSAALPTKDALATIQRLSAFDAPLRHRAEGLSWMVWGLASGSVLLVQGMLDHLPWQASAAMTGLAWPALGVLTTSAVWRLAGVGRGGLAWPMRRVALAALGIAFATFVLFEVGYFVYLRTDSYVLFAALVGALPWGLLGLIQWGRLTPPARRATLVAGAAMASALAVWVQFFLVERGDVDFLVFVAVSAGVPTALGLAWVFRR